MVFSSFKEVGASAKIVYDVRQRGRRMLNESALYASLSLPIVNTTFVPTSVHDKHIR